jgi:DNA-binding winged helix-turn-helix (wHTH) protein
MNQSMRRVAINDAAETLQIGEWIVDFASNSMSRDGVITPVQPLSMSILRYLAEHGDRVVSSEELIDHFWKNRVVGDDAVHRRIADLRKKLGDDTRHPTYISTISKRGYRLLAPVGRSEAIPKETGRPAKRVTIGLAVVVIVAGYLTTAYVVRQHNAFESALTQAETFLGDDRYQEAYRVLAPHADRSDARMDALLEKIAIPVSIFTSPDGVEVAYRFSLPGAEWNVLGETPLTNTVLPLGHYKLRFGDSIFMDATNPGVTLNSAEREQRVIEIPKEAIPQDMVFIPGG